MLYIVCEKRKRSQLRFRYIIVSHLPQQRERQRTFILKWRFCLRCRFGPHLPLTISSMTLTQTSKQYILFLSSCCPKDAFVTCFHWVVLSHIWKCRLLQSRTKLLKHFKMNENFDRENHLPQQFFSLMNVALPPKKSSYESSVLPNNSEWGEGGVKAFLRSCSCFHPGKLRNTRANWVCLN